MGAARLMRGRRRLLQSEKLAKGTLRPCREVGVVEAIESESLPQSVVR
jgi:hypothetical protein